MSKLVLIEGQSEIHEVREEYKVKSCGVTFLVREIKNAKVSIQVESPGKIQIDKPN